MAYNNSNTNKDETSKNISSLTESRRAWNRKKNNVLAYGQ